MSNLLQRVNDGNQKQGSLKGPALAFYLISLVVAFIAGGYYERAKAPVVPERATVENVTDLSTPPVQTPIPVATATPALTAHLTPPALITSDATPPRIEKAIAVAASIPTAAPRATAVTTPSIAAATPVATPVKQPGAVTVTEAVRDIPVKQSGKIVGYINLQPGQQIVPVSVENGQIKVKSGDNFVYVPVKSTDMAAAH